MKTLYLLRHATALSSSGAGDKERRLAPEGLVEAAALGVEMARKHYHPDYILCSPATRTRETYGQLILDDVPHEFPDQLYNAGSHELLAQVNALDNDYDSVMIIAHNPGIYEFTATLCVSGAPVLLNRMLNGFKPCTMALVSCPFKSWKDILPGESELQDFLESSAYNV